MPVIENSSCSYYSRHGRCSMRTSGLMNSHHLPPVSTTTWRNVGWLLSAGTVHDDVIRGDGCFCLPGGVCVTLWQEQATLSNMWFAVSLGAVPKLRSSCAKNDCQNRICVCARCHTAQLFLCTQLWAVVRPSPSWSHPEEIDSPFTS